MMTGGSLTIRDEGSDQKLVELVWGLLAGLGEFREPVEVTDLALEWLEETGR